MAHESAEAWWLGITSLKWKGYRREEARIGGMKEGRKGKEEKMKEKKKEKWKKWKKNERKKEEIHATVENIGNRK